MKHSTVTEAAPPCVKAGSVEWAVFKKMGEGLLTFLHEKPQHDSTYIESCISKLKEPELRISNYNFECPIGTQVESRMVYT